PPPCRASPPPPSRLPVRHTPPPPPPAQSSTELSSPPPIRFSVRCLPASRCLVVQGNGEAGLVRNAYDSGSGSRHDSGWRTIMPTSSTPPALLTGEDLLRMPEYEKGYELVRGVLRV